MKTVSSVLSKLSLGLSLMLLPACSGMTSSGGYCPSIIVNLDASTDALLPDGGIALPPEGDIGSWAICAAYCPREYGVCQLREDGRLLCQMGCS
jgi:hypothetical protein